MFPIKLQLKLSDKLDKLKSLERGNSRNYAPLALIPFRSNQTDNLDKLIRLERGAKRYYAPRHLILLLLD